MDELAATNREATGVRCIFRAKSPAEQRIVRILDPKHMDGTKRIIL